jgi:hypothetical protein
VVRVLYRFLISFLGTLFIVALYTYLSIKAKSRLRTATTIAGKTTTLTNHFAISFFAIFVTFLA